MGTQIRVVSAGLLVVALPRVALASSEITFGWAFLGAIPGRAADLLVRAAILWGAFAAFRARAIGRAEGSARGDGWPHPALAWIFVSFTALWTGERLLWIVGEATGMPPAIHDVASYVANAVVYAARWVVFCIAILHGILRYQVLAADARLLAGVATAWLLASGTLVVWSAGAAAGAAAAAAASAAFGGAATVTAHRFARGNDRLRSGAYLHERSLEVYRALLASALRSREADPAAERTLSAARQRLRVTAREHAILLALAEAEAVPDPGPPALHGRYRFVGRLGDGGSATILLARDATTSDLVVLKHVRGPPGGAADAFEASLREVEVARRVSHPNVVAIHDVTRVDDGAVVVMEHVPCGSLRDLLRSGPLPPGEAMGILRRILAGLGALHEAGIVHGDLKPENVLLGTDGVVKVADFGTARAAGAGRTLVAGTAPGAAAGTLRYMSPEQLAGGRATMRSDVHAAGLIAFELLAGAHPAGGGDGSSFDSLRSVLDGEPARRCPLLPPPWDVVVARALQRDPAARFPSASQMAEALAGPGGAQAPRAGIPREAGA